MSSLFSTINSRRCLTLVGYLRIKPERWLKLTEQTFNFATYARKAFIAAKGQEGLELKKEILLSLGQTPTIKDGKLIIEPNTWLVPIANHYPALEKEYLGLEPALKISPTGSTNAQNAALTALRTHWLRDLDSNQDYQIQSLTSCH